MSRALVAGAAGFLGSHLVDRLLDTGSEVVAFDSMVTGHSHNLAHLDDHPGFSYIQGDVNKPLEVGDAPFDRIYHLACPASPKAYLAKPFVTLYSGSDGTRNLIERAQADGARFLLVSTSEVYGDPEVHPQPEDYWGHVNPIGPRSVYDESKRFAEALTMAFHRYKGVEVRIARVFNTYGPRMRPDDGRVIPAFVSQSLRGDPLTIFGDGTQTRSYCYVADTARGLHMLMEGPILGPCNIGNPHELTVRELAETIRDRAGSGNDIIFQPLPEDDPKLRRPDITRARTELGWEPVTPFDEGVQKTIDWFRAYLEIDS